MRPELIEQHITAMTTASSNLLRQMEDEGLDYRLVMHPEDTGTLHVHVRALTPELDARIRRCLSGTGMQLAVRRIARALTHSSESGVRPLACARRADISRPVRE